MVDVIVVKTKLHTFYIHKACTDYSISLSNEQPPGVSEWLSRRVILFCLPQLFFSFSSVIYQIKEETRNTVISGAPARISRKQRIPLALIIFVSKRSMSLCQHVLRELFNKSVC